MPGRRLVLVRHAKAEAAAASDFERALTTRGLDDAAEAGRWLATTTTQPDLALVSAALRTRQTWAALSEAAGWALEAGHDEGLYAAGPETALDMVHTAPATCTSLLLLGHNPTVGELAALLSDGEGDSDAENQLVMGFPTCAVAVLDLDGDWADLEAGAARLSAFHVGREE